MKLGRVMGFALMAFAGVAGAALAACGPPAEPQTGPHPGPAPSQSAPAAPTSGGGIVAPAPGETRLLAGRLLVKLPEGATVVARQRSIMSAEESSEEETRALLEPGSGGMARFVLLARELFATSTGDVVADARTFVKEDSEETYDVTPAALGGGAGVGVAWFTPQGRAPVSEGPVLVRGALVRMPDDSLVALSFFVLPQMRGEVAAYRAKAEGIVRSVRNGGKRLATRTDVKLESGTGATLFVRLPRPAVITTQQGPDFIVHRARTLAKVGEHPSTLGVYFGGHPSYQHKQAEDEKIQVAISPASFLGQSVDWHDWGSPTHRTAEVMAKLGDHDVVHLWVSGDPASVAQLKKTAETAKIEARK
jgi:hypothetical protein